MSDLFELVNKHCPGFLSVFRGKAKKKCLLIGEYDKTLYFVVSGLFDSSDANISHLEAHKHTNLIPRLKERIEQMLEWPFPQKEKPRVEFVKASGDILYKKTLVNENFGRTYSYVSLDALLAGASNPSKDDIAHYYCCERKLYAYLNQKRVEMKDFRFLLCRYLPCEDCCWAIDGLPNFYVFGAGEVSRVLIPENLAIPKNKENESCLLCEELGNVTLDNKDYLSMGLNYLFYKKSI